MKLKNLYTKHKYQIITLFAHIQFTIFFAWWMIPLGILFNNIVNYLYLHRVYTHGMHEFKRKYWLFLACTLNLGSPHVYAAVHMKHHATHDTDNDPHSPVNTPIWKMLVSLWNPSFTPDRRYLKRFDKSMHKHHLKIALATAILAPWVIVVAHWMSKIVIILTHLKGEPVNLKYWGWLTWGEEQHKTHHDGGQHNDALVWIARKLQQSGLA